MNTQVILLMGVSGSGKTTVGALLASTLKWPYADADSFHSAANVAKMAAGHPLTDADRKPWLEAIRAWIDERVTRGEPAVVSCSALKRKYRDGLRRPEVTLVYLRGTRAQIEQRLSARQGHFFQASLLASQFADLEEPSAEENAIIVSIDGTPGKIVDAIIAATSKPGIARENPPREP
jgi:carbohydrate kinase (thermoresistant glucokinase family)